MKEKKTLSFQITAANMACAKPDMSVRSVDEEDEEERSKERTAPPMVTTYLANAIVMDPKKPLHDLMKKQPCVVGVRSKLKTNNYRGSLRQKFWRCDPRVEM